MFKKMFLFCVCIFTLKSPYLSLRQLFVIPVRHFGSGISGTKYKNPPTPRVKLIFFFISSLVLHDLCMEESTYGMVIDLLKRLSCMNIYFLHFLKLVLNIIFSLTLTTTYRA